MEFTKKFNELKSIFIQGKEKICIEGSDVEIHSIPFSSSSNLVLPSVGIPEHTYVQQTIAMNDSCIKENMLFSYPIFVPKNGAVHKKAIILLHGLNEKSWHKYLPWAYYLSEKTKRPVILFPISFHMNRCPESWANPRVMIPLLNQRQKTVIVDKATFANVALSQRLTDEPLRFFTSGRQSAEDIVSLLKTIKDGSHPFLEKNSQVDFFAYSIGAFLSQILFIANPEGLLSKSRLFLFCGGAHFSEMFGTSRLIMDSQAFISLRKYYLGEFVDELKTDSAFSQYIRNSPLGNAFRAMLDPESLKSFRENTLQKLSNRIKIIALKKDEVIPAKYIQSTFSCIKHRVKKIVKVFDFPYEYSHEVPFPILNNSNYLQVDQSFEKVFKSAVAFLR
ncbi:MAG: DUF6051 family protein [Tenuifilaceae bacterium]